MTDLAHVRARQHHVAMSKALGDAIRRVLAQAPGSIRELAKAAGVPHTTLWRIQQGERDATPEVARAVAKALGRWAKGCESAERTLLQALTREESE